MHQPETSQAVDAHRVPPGSAPNGSVPMVGIGASAGGLEAFTRLLEHLPPDTGFAFVLVQHLDASHPSSLSTILGRATAMPVAEARDGTPVAANRVYVIPPNTQLTVRERVLRLEARAPAVVHMPIDHLLQSLAEDCGNGAVGVVLSGSGSDGSAGLLAIKEANGITFAQEPTSAEFPSMPSMAIAAGAADVVLPPEAIATELARIAHHPHLVISSRAAAPPPEEVTAEGEHFRTICSILLESSGVDFSLYRETTAQRRILRRLAVRNVTDLEAYARLLADSPEECAALYRDLLIGVTSFFRDPESFVALKRLVFPTIVRGRSADSPIRIWVPGCATGEEVYSILIELQDYQRESHTSFPVQVFATDISEEAIAKARTGRYPEKIAAQVSPERLQRYFSKLSGSYQIAKSLREICVFSRHNLLDDPPFSRLDLISCRNVLIYLQDAHRKVIPLFHYALVDHGFLCLGRSETTHRPELFSELEPRQRSYSKRLVAKKAYTSFARTREQPRAAGGPGDLTGTVASRSAPDWSRDADRVLLSKYSPPGVLVDEGLEVLEIRGQTAPFVALTAGKASLQLLNLLPDTGLFLEVEKLTQEASQTGLSARRDGIPYAAEGRSGEVSVEVIPLRSNERRAYLILFERVDSAARDERGADTSPLGSNAAAASRDLRIAKLTEELQKARARLVSLVDAHQVSDEDSQRVTEDALSANEELRSLTEELETAKEELQATNEELLTVNRELEARNIALISARDLAKATVETVRVPLAVI
ncbi:MAG TPA: chemotaxis protein CheB, partial [Polyangiaceae bacterium]|nr:chemotaxis protein CheB [Polyangiaceae bacterium]